MDCHSEPTRAQLVKVYNAATALLKEREDSGLSVVATKWDIVNRLIGMNHLMVDNCMKVLAEKGVFTLRKNVNHIPLILPKQ